ncbi:hypothetical protein CRI65_06110 [Escherichia sp. E3659]|nr:hypothetical protein CRI67_22085 [Escherichia sp. E4702]TGB87496.1 hypothetical protein CRI65_06110 [Escherichia sp. E3659]TGC04718.1 hypothetical protein CRI63_05150 [Escherichia sp. E2661]
MIVCSPVLLWEQYSRTKTFDKRISRYGTDDFILSKKTAKERLIMQLASSHNSGKLLYCILLMHKKSDYEIYYLLVFIKTKIYDKVIIFALNILLYCFSPTAYYIHNMYINNIRSLNIFFKCN